MHFYRFHVGDYMTHTAHLTPEEDLVYRRILDRYYMHETPPSGSPQEIARLIRMPECGAEVRQILDEFFDHFDQNGRPEWRQKRVDAEIAGFQALRESGRLSANKRWHGVEMGDPMGDLCEPTANPMLTSNHKPITNNTPPNPPTGGKRFKPPSAQDVLDYCNANNVDIDALMFVDFYESKNWMVGKNKMKSWKAAVRNWARRDREQRNTRSTRDQPLADFLGDRSWAE